MRIKTRNSAFLLPVTGLFCFGLVQVYSSSYMFAFDTYSDALFFFRKQVVFAIIAFGVMLGITQIPPQFIRKWGFVFWLLSAAAVLVTFVPGVGVRVGGSLRWIDLPFGLRFEASEFLKVSLALFVSSIVHRYHEDRDSLNWYAVVLALVVPICLLLVQPDFGSFALMASVIFGYLIFSGLRWRYFAATIGMALPALYFIAMGADYRRARVAAFLDPWSDPEQNGFQVIQSMLTFSSGGFWGTGLGEGQGKLFFLPEAHTDFTLAVLGEETGFLGFTILMLTYGGLIYLGIRLALKSQEIFNRYLALGLTILFASTVFVNIGVTLGVFPTKGLTLPFLSYGGSSLVAMGILFGLLMNIEKQEKLG